MPKRCFNAWTIIHLPTGKYLPQKMFRTSSKGTNAWQPRDASQKPYSKFPRLFSTKGRASRCLAQMLRGIPEWVEVGHHSWDVPEQKLEYRLLPEHKREDYSIIEVTLYA